MPHLPNAVFLINQFLILMELLTQIPGHPNMHKLPGVETNTGALGHGLINSRGNGSRIED